MCRLFASALASGWPRAAQCRHLPDGTDGPTDAAGAVVDGGTAGRAAAAGLSIDEYLKNNDAYHFFKALGDGLIFTGATGA
eukprot:SAG22_NODE_213_length_15041_cov_3.683732_2_plen_81_part_00